MFLVGSGDHPLDVLVFLDELTVVFEFKVFFLAVGGRRWYDWFLRVFFSLFLLIMSISITIILLTVLKPKIIGELVGTDYSQFRSLLHCCYLYLYEINNSELNFNLNPTKTTRPPITTYKTHPPTSTPPTLLQTTPLPHPLPLALAHILLSCANKWCQ